MWNAVCGITNKFVWMWVLHNLGWLKCCQIPNAKAQGAFAQIVDAKSIMKQVSWNSQQCECESSRFAVPKRSRSQSKTFVKLFHQKGQKWDFHGSCSVCRERPSEASSVNTNCGHSHLCATRRGAQFAERRQSLQPRQSLRVLLVDCWLCSSTTPPSLLSPCGLNDPHNKRINLRQVLTALASSFQALISFFTAPKKEVGQRENLARSTHAWLWLTFIHCAAKYTQNTDCFRSCHEVLAGSGKTASCLSAKGDSTFWKWASLVNDGFAFSGRDVLPMIKKPFCNLGPRTNVISGLLSSSCEFAWRSSGSKPGTTSADLSSCLGDT